MANHGNPSADGLRDERWTELVSVIRDCVRNDVIDDEVLALHLGDDVNNEYMVNALRNNILWSHIL